MNAREFRRHSNHRIAMPTWKCCSMCGYLVFKYEPAISSKRVRPERAYCSANNGKLFRTHLEETCNYWRSDMQLLERKE